MLELFLQSLKIFLTGLAILTLFTLAVVAFGFITMVFYVFYKEVIVPQIHKVYRHLKNK